MNAIHIIGEILRDDCTWNDLWKLFNSIVTNAVPYNLQGSMSISIVVCDMGW